eukprot:3730839-Amphidinium_carterae.1
MPAAGVAAGQDANFDWATPALLEEAMSLLVNAPPDASAIATGYLNVASRLSGVHWISQTEHNMACEDNNAGALLHSTLQCGVTLVPQSSTRTCLFQQTLALQNERDLAARAANEATAAFDGQHWSSIVIKSSYLTHVLAAGMAQALRCLAIRPASLFLDSAWPVNYGEDDRPVIAEALRLDGLTTTPMADSVASMVNRLCGLELNKSFLVSMTWLSEGNPYKFADLH